MRSRKVDFLLLVLSGLLITGCSKSGNSLGQVPGSEVVDEPVNPVPISPGTETPELPVEVPVVVAPVSSDPPITQAQIFEKIQEVKTELSNDPVYSISTSDVELLLSEGLISEASELEGWVK